MQHLNDVKWVIEEDYKDLYPELIAELEKQGYEYKILPFGWVQSYVSMNSVGYKAQFFPYESIVVFLGSVRAFKFICREWIWYSAEINDLLDYRQSYYFKYIPRSLTLNDTGFYLPLYDLFLNPRYSDIFIRPDTGDKLFDGQILNKDTSWEEFSNKNGLTKADNFKFVYCAQIRDDIQGEIRFLCDSKKVITGSYYKLQFKGTCEFQEEYTLGEKKEPIQFIESLILPKLPEELTRFGLIIDIALTPDGPRIIEFNHPNTAGIYKMNLEKYVDSMSRFAYDRYQEGN